ncbi:uncharacterized protein LOC124172877 isoform X1 [Ischnura elegans]|uniref:uncharacterized protein LOC124172877 isoform X1 n=1 Tax=Ischnura elegans TaxID=197161 RepID=UPI001ED8A448|nr:uncharacterized protein LOC124172877 isoform X1 [Ischnura elegans]
MRCLRTRFRRHTPHYRILPTLQPQPREACIHLHANCIVIQEEEYVEELGAEEGPFEGTLGEEEAYDEHYEGGYEETMEEETGEEGQLEDVMDVRAAPADGSTEAVALVQQDQDVNTAL